MSTFEVQKRRADIWSDLQMYRSLTKTATRILRVAELQQDLKDIDEAIKAGKSECEILGHKYESHSMYDMQGACIRCGAYEE